MNRSRFEEIWKNRYIEQTKEEFFDLVQEVSKLNPKNILEIGVKKGGSFEYWIDMIPEDGVVLGIDRKPIVLKWLKENNSSYYTTAKYTDIFIGYSSNKYTVACVEDTLDGELLDFIHIDGHHFSPVPLEDFQNYTPFLRSGGLVCIADIGDREKNIGGENGTIELWNNLPEGKTQVKMPHHGQGLGLWYKP